MNYLRAKSSLLLVLAVAVVWLSLAVMAERDIATAQAPNTLTPAPQWDAEAMAQAFAAATGGMQRDSNLDSLLSEITRQYASGQLTARAAAAGAPVAQERSVAVTLYIQQGYVESVRSYLEGNGAGPRNIGTDYIEAYVPISLLSEAAQQDGVIKVEAIVPGQPAQAATGEAAGAHGATAWHTAGHKGAGVKVGIVDNFEGFRGDCGV